jgi:two-component system response regulator AtoC
MQKSKKINLLLIEDEDFDVRRVQNTIKLFDEIIAIKRIVSNGYDALSILEEDSASYDLVIMDYQIAGPIRGEELIKKIKQIDSALQIIVITKLTINITDFEFAKKLVDAGAYWYCTKYPGDIDKYIYQPTDFLMSIFNAYEKKKLEVIRINSNKKLNRNIEDILESKRIIGDSRATSALKSQIDKYSQSDVNILIYGASGTGKELVANNIHFRSKRKLEKFVPINCGGLPHDLIESELFGYEKGAFTGASSKKLGLFEIAEGGTIFLDEVSELPPSAQVKLLRVIQEGEIEKIGRTDKVNVDVRIIAATNKDLVNMVNQNLFREDLYYRLNVVPIQIKPLRERKDDILQLFNHFLSRFSGDMGIRKPNLDSTANDFLTNYSWHGNVRELKNIAQRILFTDADPISGDVVKNTLLPGALKNNKGEEVFNFGQMEEIKSLRDIEKTLRQKYFKFVRDNSASDAEAAKKLGIAPPNYYRMCKELGLK